VVTRDLETVTGELAADSSVTLVPVPEPAPRPARAVDGGSISQTGRLDRVVAVVDRVLPIVRGVGRAAGLLALASAAAVGVLALALVVERPDTGLPSGFDATLLAVLVLALLTPAVGLLLARWVVNGLVDLPERLSSQIGRGPGLSRDQAERLSMLALSGGAPTAPRQGGGMLRRSWGAGRILADARGDLASYTAAFRLLHVSYLLYALVAAALAMAELFVLPFAAVLVLAF